MARKRTPKYSGSLEVIHPDCAGIDIGQKQHYVAVDPSRFEPSVRHFGCCTQDLYELADWLRACGVEIVAMEATGVYWIPLYEVLDRRGFEVHLVNSRATKQVSGRKTDVLDCQWIRQLMCCGLLKGAFRPPDEICELRSYVRQRQRLNRDAARSIQHMQKALTEMNVQLDTVLSNLMGATGQRILRAIVAGERDPRVLAAYRDRRVKADEATIARSLEGTWRAEHVFALTQALARYDFFQTQMRACDDHLVAIIDAQARHDDELPPPRSPGRNQTERALQQVLRKLMGVDLTAIPCIGPETALTIASELGPDLSAFQTVEHFASWATLAPNRRITGGKPAKGKAPKRHNRVGQALKQAAQTARNSQSYIGACHRARLRRMEASRAIKATAHQLARLIYAMLTRGEEYIERGIEYHEARRVERELYHLKRRAKRLGYALESVA